MGTKRGLFLGGTKRHYFIRGTMVGIITRSVRRSFIRVHLYGSEFCFWCRLLYISLHRTAESLYNTILLQILAGTKEALPWEHQGICKVSFIFIGLADFFFPVELNGENRQTMVYFIQQKLTSSNPHGR